MPPRQRPATKRISHRDPDLCEPAHIRSPALEDASSARRQAGQTQSPASPAPAAGIGSRTGSAAHQHSVLSAQSNAVPQCAQAMRRAAVIFSEPTSAIRDPRMIWTPPAVPGGVPDHSGSARSRLTAASGENSNPAIPEVVITLDVHPDVGLVVRPLLILGQRDRLLGLIVVLAFVHGLLHRGGEVLHVGEVGLGVVLVPSAEPPARDGRGSGAPNPWR